MPAELLTHQPLVQPTQVGAAAALLDKQMAQMAVLA
jgi:hypothetical protein